MRSRLPTIGILIRMPGGVAITSFAILESSDRKHFNEFPKINKEKAKEIGVDLNIGSGSMNLS